MAARLALGDEQFCEQAGLSRDDWEMASLARRAIARCSKIPAESIRPDDIFDEITEDLMFPYWNNLAFLLALRQEAGLVFRRQTLHLPTLRRIKIFGWTIRPGLRVDEWFRDAVPALRRALYIAQ